MSQDAAVDLLAHFPDGAIPRAAQVALLDELGGALAEVGDDDVPRVFVIEAPPGVGKSHLAMTLARWSGDAYLLTSQKLLQDQYELLQDIERSGTVTFAHSRRLKEISGRYDKIMDSFSKWVDSEGPKYGIQRDREH